MFKQRNVDHEFDKERLDLLLVKLSFFDSRQKAITAIMSGQVFVDEIKIQKSGTKIRFGSVVKVKLKDHEWVSRGGVKLSHAVKLFGINLKGKECIDIGASTGGFSDVLLTYGAKKVYAIDVGYGQLAWKIRNNEKVVVLEKFNARNIKIDDFSNKVDIIVCDVSFISIKKIIPKAMNTLNKGGLAVILIKPQFELDKGRVKKGGIVEDPSLHKEICNDIQKWSEDQLSKKVLGIIPSPIKGQKGNKEFFICIQN